MGRKILGLDLGTNSIGWALIDDNEKKILGMGSRIIPMSQDKLGDFGKGNSVSQTAERTGYRSIRRLRERQLLRRERLHRVLNILGALPEHYSKQIDFEHRLGKFLNETEPKLVYNSKEFIFKKSFDEMLEEFRLYDPKLLEEGKKVPYDWTIYYLRKKALTQKIELEELAWILLNFNQKRGYYQLRGEEDEENPNKLIEFHSLKIIEVTSDEKPNSKGDIWYSLFLENGWVYRRSSKVPLFDWKDKVRNFIVTTELNEDGSVKTDKEGNEKRNFRAPNENDWTLLKKKTEQEIDTFENTVGAYIYNSLLQNPKLKIIGKLVRTIERKYYKVELNQILEKQKAFHPELQSEDLFNDCIRELYRNNDAHQLLLSGKDIVHLFVEDIIFYQRPLRSQKSNISNCSLENRQYQDKEGVTKKQPLKVISKSNPYYQEFRIWQWIYNLSIYKKEDDNNVTSEFLNNTNDFENLFEFLDNRKEIEQKALIKYLLEGKGLKGKLLNAEAEKYRWNYVEDKKYPCNETKALIVSRLAKLENIGNTFLIREIEQQLWHIIYSVTDKIDYEKALGSFARKHQINEIQFVTLFKKFPPFRNEYASFSEKAIKKLLPLMRIGKYWNWEMIDRNSKARIEKILTGEYDINIKDKIREFVSAFTQESNFQGLQLWLAQYIVYGRHSEAATIEKWCSVADLEKYIKEFKQHSLKNPIVEQVITETLRVVRDIWSKYGNGSMDYFNEIHIELGREMKNTAEDRKRMTSIVAENENTNLRIKGLLVELMNDGDVENVRPYSPMQQEILKLYEEGVLNSGIEIAEDILKISKTAQPTSSELKRYKLWLEQKYRSPYTGEVIPLNKLFTVEYEIEHIIPQSQYFDDSLSNKVICEAAINKLKDNNIAMNFIKKFHGKIVDCGFGKTVKVFEVTEYEYFVKQNFGKNPSKRNKLLIEDIPQKMIERQMNDTRYISKFISALLSNIVRSEANDDGVNSKNIIPCNGKITSELKNDWGLNDVWNDLILPRFQRMNLISNTSNYTSWNENHQKFLPTVPLEISKGFSKKRIDHRHHAMDALVIACATRDHVNLLNNQSAKSDQKRYDLQNKLRRKETYFNQNENRQKDTFKEFKKPWDNFTMDAKKSLEKIIVSFKQNIRVINKANNNYEKWVENYGVKIKKSQKQNGTNWAIRKSLHTPMPYGKKSYAFELLKISKNVGKKELIIDEKIKAKVQEAYLENNSKVSDTQNYLEKNPIQDENGEEIVSTQFRIYADKFRRRQPISELSNRGQGGIKVVEDARKLINKIADIQLRKDLMQHLIDSNNDIDIAFSTDGLEKFNSKRKIPVYKLPIAESGSGRFSVGNTIGTIHKWVEADKGTNLFFAIYEDENGKRSFESIPLNIVVERQKQGLSSVPLENDNENKLLFELSPNDLVYLPIEDEKGNVNGSGQLLPENGIVNHIYKMVSCTGGRSFFVPMSYASAIIANEYGSNNKNERTIRFFREDDILESNDKGDKIPLMIKSNCIKLKINRLGDIEN